MQPWPQNPKVLAARAQLDFSTSTIKWLSSAHSLGSLRANQLWRLLAAFCGVFFSVWINILLNHTQFRIWKPHGVSWAKSFGVCFRMLWFKAISSAPWGLIFLLILFFFQLGRNNKHRRCVVFSFTFSDAYYSHTSHSSPPARHRTVNCSSVACVLCHRSCRTSTSLCLIQFVSDSVVSLTWTEFESSLFLFSSALPDLPTL
ncbi:hypothetical protein B0H14DRAFT_1354264 [Mycena olivaceomarginata]|nr:hypothetical protein B0H14DRAFT_1354264 [Mycena olivaceomarginata]